MGEIGGVHMRENLLSTWMIHERGTTKTSKATSLVLGFVPRPSSSRAHATFDTSFAEPAQITA
jgi:hypothetical protein